MARTIDVEEVERFLDQGRPVVDVLPADHYARQHIPGAVNVPLDDPDFEALIQDAVPDKDAPVALYCLDPPCEASPAAAHVMEDHLGYRDVRLFEGGLLAWRRAGKGYEGKGPERLRLEDLKGRE